MINWTKYSYKVDNKKTDRRKKKYVNPSYNINDIYRFYKETFVNNSVSKKHDVTLAIFKEIQYEYNKVLSQLILEGNQVKLPYGVGEMGVRRRKMRIPKDMKNCLLDYVHYNKTGEKIYYFAEKNGGWTAKLYWRKGRARIDHKSYYSFEACKTTKLALCKIMRSKGGYLKYFEAKTNK